MAEAVASRIWLGRAAYCATALLLMFIQLMPLDARPDTWAAPDWLLALTLVWIARRPEHLPVYSIAIIFLLADFLFQRPPGLWTAFVVIMTEVLRTRSQGIRNMPFALEWGTVALGIVAMTVGYRAVQLIVMIPLAPLGLTLIQMTMTIVFYPLVVGLAYFIFGLSRPALGQVDNRGAKL